ncbi:hypothetical protein F383_31197 [Gossypium arboreum]|uniref:Uncharacterized protein n=1 Tax=Gossypium arboreum TaxID=29729 RepID=A0A0B0PDF6_GOSAR|nr:hypothetical protein F383_31197 [Gossypium arboreum]
MTVLLPLLSTHRVVNRGFIEPRGFMGLAYQPQIDTVFRRYGACVRGLGAGAGGYGDWGNVAAEALAPCGV